MTRGNQRDLARAKAQKKQADANKGKRADGLSVEQRKARDAEIVKQKQMAKEAEKAAGGGTGGGGKK
ncbi:four F5 protein [Acaromyces ingoldii]|uniref:Four F5 protein n=1 Tax=Acaromyces ingoldii TaxID=215250 RepID=A0A316YZ62_9BASI|nr:four F5 protein [Acaromyces ingoldii]PWN94054.1 four F5 protein [Acaromyces ingoldii]